MSHAQPKKYPHAKCLHNCVGVFLWLHTATAAAVKNRLRF